MKRKTILTLSAFAAVAVIGGATIPAIAVGGPWSMMGGHAPGMMMQGGDGAGWGPGRMGQRGGHGPMGMNGFTENPVFQAFDADKSGALSEVEFAALFSEVTKGMAARPFAMLDDDGNKEISAEEITFPVKMMARMGRLTDINAGTPTKP